MPADAPLRFRHPPFVELSTFAGWSEVSKTFAPLYVTDGAIAPGSPLGAEVAAIEKAEATPLGRAERALELVQDKVRYLAVDMNGGNYVPQKAARTWELRYGDCKAKTLLLLALLHAMKIEAEPALASAGLGDLVPQRLPSALAFNHVLVRATVDGETLWLDGTNLGSRLADIHDTPAFRHVLPVRAGGAELVDVPTRANARPMLDVSVEADETASVDLPSAFAATAVVRGPAAAMMKVASSQLGEKEKRQAVAQFFTGFLGEAQFGNTAITPDDASGTVTLTARGVVTTAWKADGREQKRGLTRVFEGLDFSPDRGRPAWQAIPAANPGPQGMRYRLRLRLPEDGKGYRLEGEPDVKARIAGYEVSRTVRIEGGLVTVDERGDASGTEIPAADIPAERDRFATANARLPRIVAPEKARHYWDLAGADPAGATQVKAIDDALAKAIAASPEDATGYVSRATFRAGIGDRKGALADLGRALAIEPSVNLYLRRAGTFYDLGDLPAASADAEAARKLDPGSSDAIMRVAFLKADRGDLAGGLALLDERIALGGGDTRNALRAAKAEVLGTYGDPAEAVKIWDALIAEKPGSPGLLNGRCWVKGTHSILLETALKDCTEAVELSSKTNEVLDSRAMVWYRMGRDQEALRDLDAVLAAAPGKAASRYLRAIVLTRMHREAEAAKDFALARRLSPEIDRQYARFGLGPKAAASAAANAAVTAKK
jgi:tetratricopeptide (TPR) repeat protein